MLLLWLLPLSAAQASTPTIELYTMGQGDDAFTLFGHAAMCVVDGKHARCFNYGTADFSRPGALAFNFVRGHARYWVSTTPRDALLRAYRESDRTMYRQVLPLSPERARRAAALLDRDLRPDRRTYVYDHFNDNCATRLRDLIDVVTDGALRASSERVRYPEVRDLVRDGFAGHPGLLAASELLIGRDMDRDLNGWEAMFLPSALRDEVSRALGAAPTVVYARRAPLDRGSPMAGRALVFVLGAALSLLLAAGFAAKSRPLRTASLVLAGLAFGMTALLIDGVIVASPIPGLRFNELALAFLPFDFALVALRGRALRAYAALRAGWLVLLGLMAAAGVLVQPVGAPLLALLLFFTPVAVVNMRRASPESLGEPPRTR